MDLTKTLTAATTELLQRVQRSLVILHNGRHGVGAGIIWRQNGLVITNNHVVARGRVRVALADGSEYPAEVIAKDPEVDLAMISIDANDLPVAMIADSHNLSVGQFVMAVGHPWGQRGAVTAGLISSLGIAQTRGKRGSVDIIRTDVRLAPGNSGGPLVNANGAVVGINTMIVGGDQGIAIPSHIVSAFVDKTLAKRDHSTGHRGAPRDHQKKREAFV